MELEKSASNNSPMTFDEVSMERSKSFVKALQELKNLRPQLYSAADYCEKSYLHSEQKQMVLDNLKDYAVKAVVNAVDHLGTVASKLTDIFEQQHSELLTMELRASCVNQQLLTCRVYNDKEGLRQQQLLALIPRHHKHYILPTSVNKRVHFSPLRQADARQNHSQAISRLQPADAPASKSLSWHLGSETKSTLKGTAAASPSSKAFAKTTGVFLLLDDDHASTNKKQPAGSQLSGTYSVAPKDLGAAKAPIMVQKQPSDNNPRRDITHAPIQTKSVLSAFFVKQKMSKLKPGYVS